MRGTPEIKPCVAHFRQDFVLRTERFIYNLITHHVHYRPIVLTARRFNHHEMPFQGVFSLERTNRSLCDWMVDKALRRLLGKAIYFARQCRRERAVVLHAHFGLDALQILGLSQDLGIPLVTSFYGYDTADKYAGRLDSVFARSNALIVEGSAMKQRLIQLGCAPDKIHVIHIGVEMLPEASWHRPTRKNRYRLLFVGRFVEKKGLRYLLEALGKIRSDEGFKNLNVHLDIVGDEVSQPACDYRTLAHDLGVAPAVRFHGMLPYEDLAALLRECDLIVQPSVAAADGDVEGGAPTVLTIAHAAGLPAVATYHCDIPEVILHEQTGLLCPERDAAALADAIATLLADADLRVRMSEAARTHIRENFSLEAQVQETERIYDALLGG